MPKNKRAYPAVDAPLASQEEHAGGSPKKKKKKRSKSHEEEGMAASSLLSLSFSSVSSSGLSPTKKKKKKKNEGKKVDARVNGIVEKRDGEVLGGKTNKKKKTATVTEDKIQNEEEVGSKKVKKKKDKEETPKKKKIGKTVMEEMERSQEEEEQKGEETGVKKKTKKKSKKKDVIMTSPSCPASATTATTTTGKNSKLDEEEEWKIEAEDEEIDTEAENDSAWSEEATEELLNRIASQLPPPNRDTRSCRVSLKSVDWEKAALPGRSPDACMEHFMAYYKKINIFKNLTTVLEEAKKLATSGLLDRRNLPLRPIHRFLKEFFTPELKAKAKRTGESLFTMGHKAWKNLPEHQKDVYVRSYYEERSKIKPGAVKSKPRPPSKPQPPVEPPKLPYKLCWETEGQAELNVNQRTYYSSLAPSKQVPYIRRAVEDMMRYESDLQDYQASHPEYQPPPCHVLAKVDLKTFLDAHGCPALPAVRPSLMFYKEALASGQLSSVPGLQRMAAAMKIYKDFSKQEKANYKKKQEQEVKQFEEDLKEWSSEQDEVTRYALKKYKEVVPFARPQKQKKAHHVKVDDIFPHKVPAATSCPRFLGEPPRPPASPYNLFTAKFRATVSDSLSGSDLKRATLESWKALGEEEKEAFFTHCRASHQQYEKELKEYVREMDPKTRRLFLGFNRVYLFRFFHNRDVFEEEFPNSERYPLLVKGQHQPSSPARSHHHISVHEDDKQEEEEEVLPASPTSKKKRALTPILFSSLEFSPTNTESKTKPAPSTTSPKKSTAQQLACFKSKEENEDEEEEDVTSAWHSPAPAAPVTQAKKKAHVSVAAANAGKKSKVSPAPPPPESESESESEESEDEDDITPAWHSPAVPTPTTKAKKKAHVSVAAVNAGKKSKVHPAPPPPESESEDSEDEDDVTPAWHSPAVPTLTTKAKKKAHVSVAAANAGKKSKVSPAPPPPESESEESEDEDDVTPAWHSPAVPTTKAKKQQKPQLQQQQQKVQDDSSSSGFSDSDSSD